MAELTTKEQMQSTYSTTGRTWMGDYNIGKRYGDDIYFNMIDFAEQKKMPYVLKFTYDDFTKLDTGLYTK